MYASGALELLIASWCRVKFLGRWYIRALSEVTRRSRDHTLSLCLLRQTSETRRQLVRPLS